MRNASANVLKAGLALLAGWVGAALVLLSLALVSQTALADDAVPITEQPSPIHQSR
jgi:hypothetical protein